ncbi:hypothetical protein CHLRE_02g113250v5 [Chlamydomonas reinhardtii]|uniref:Uncharacterized protein n=1 Tax=Chlamydomonas reinhardtii TaxID=3055 RepID=A0A2K3E347_CHLRE|nr:uncharacterized protein CHLRE_02g113250v5 [Chlamydomonas reinhardtii]PNW87205.1 hypothetical protein CHLRE_02g113250v5 [Chlamydomonas reinhardtii]
MNTPSCTVPLVAQPLDIAVSASAGLLAAGLVSGAVQLVSFSCPQPADNADDGTTAAAGGSSSSSSSQLSYALSLTIDAPASSAAPSSKKKKAKHGAGEDAGGGEEDDEDEAPSCRAVCFMPGGNDWLLAGYSDKAVRAYDVRTGKLVHEYGSEHDQQVSRVYGLECAPSVFASGDEEGLVLLWDSRAAKPIYRYTQHTDYITDMTLHAKDQCLVVTSGDATLSVHDLRKRKARARSEDDNDDELLSCCCVKGGKKVVAGTQSGVLHLYSWGYFNDCSDRFPGHPESVQALVAFDDDTLLTGSSDGAVRVVGVLPNRLLGILGQHNGDHEVERLALSADKHVLVSMSHDSAVKLWDLALLHEDDDEDGEEEEEEGGEEGAEEGAQAGAEEEAGGDGEAAGDAQEDEDDDEDEDESDFDSSDFSDSSDEEGEGEDDERAPGSGGGSEGEGGGQKGGKTDAKDSKARAKMEATVKPKAAKAAAKPSEKAAGDRAAAALAAALGGGGAAAAGGKAAATAAGDGDDDADSDSDSDGGGKKKKGKRDRERTKWTKGMEAKKKPDGNFFADIL